MNLDYEVVVIGAGPAGITAAMYLKRSEINCLLIEKDVPGGLLNKSSVVENYPGVDETSGPLLAEKFFEKVKELNIPVKYEEVIEIEDLGTHKIIKTNKGEISTKSIILAIGRKPRTLDVENAEKFEGLGISFCSLCDGMLFKGEEVAVVGGGNSALEEAIYLSKICKKVSIIYRSDTLRGDKILVSEIKEKDNIEIIYNAVVKSFQGKEALKSIILETKDGEKELFVKGCFIFIGYQPATDFLKKLEILDETGYIISDERCQTKRNLIYAAGDVIRKEAYQIVTATSDGAIAAVACLKDLNNEE